MSHRLIYYDVFFLYVKRNIINTDQSYGLCQLCGSNHHCDKCMCNIIFPDFSNLSICAAVMPDGVTVGLGGAWSTVVVHEGCD